MRPGSAIVVVVVFTVLAALTHAQESPPQAQPAKLADLLNEAERNSPEIRAARKRWDASKEVPSQVSTLPDPEVMFQQLSVGSPRPFAGYTNSEMANVALGVSQDIPYPGKLRLRGQIASKEADVWQEQYESVRRTVLDQVKTNYFQLSYLATKLQILSSDQDLLKPIEQSAEAHFRQAPDEEVAAKALEEIRSAERLSGFGRFARRLQGLFQASNTSQSKPRMAHLKAAPIMMSAGLLLLLATGVLFLLSKPESAVPSHFRQPTGLVGGNHQSSIATSPAEPPVTEDELAGHDASAGAATASTTAKKGAIQTTSPRRYSFADSGTPPEQPGVQSGPNELGTPATVFVDDPSAGPVLKQDIAAPTQTQAGLELPVGTEIIAHTTNAISSGLESPVVAVVDRPIQLGNTTVIPEGARVIGQTAGAVKNRVNVRFRWSP